MSGTASPPTQMRTYGRVTDPQSGARFWVQVDPDASGFNDNIYLTTLIQCIKLNWGESPFFADWGIPAYQSVVTQVFPDFYMALMQQRFAPFFLSLVLAKQPPDRTNYWQAVIPTYDLAVQFHDGAQITTTVIPQALVDGRGQPIVDSHGNAMSVGTKSGTFIAA